MLPGPPIEWEGPQAALPPPALEDQAFPTKASRQPVNHKPVTTAEAAAPEPASWEGAWREFSEGHVWMETGMNPGSGQTALGWLWGAEKTTPTVTVILHVTTPLVNVTSSEMPISPPELTAP